MRQSGLPQASRDRLKSLCAEVLPAATLARKLVEGGTLELMELDDAAF